MIYISLGSNLGNRLSNIRVAVDLIKKEILQDSYESIIIETKAILKEGAPNDWNKPFLNMIIAGKTKLSPDDLLQKLQATEQKLGREKLMGNWSPRPIDLDILLYDDKVINSENLVVPHAELLNRDFFIHLLAMMPEKYMPKIQSVRADEFAHNKFRCKELFARSYHLGPEIMGVLNITPDSFADAGRNFDVDTAIKNAHQMVDNGAEIIDVGAQSTNPVVKEFIGADAEYERLKPVLDGLKGIDAKISIDTYHPDLIRKLLSEYKIDWINDVTGSLDDKILKEVADAGSSILTMHSLSVPHDNSNVLPHDSCPVEAMSEWGKMMMEKMLKLGFSKDKIILDPGIGFGKSPYQNLAIIRGAKRLKEDGHKILIGHSRKSFMGSFYDKEAPERDLETHMISANIAKSGVDYIRVHNVRDQHRLFVADKVTS